MAELLKNRPRRSDFLRLLHFLSRDGVKFVAAEDVDLSVDEHFLTSHNVSGLTSYFFQPLTLLLEVSEDSVGLGHLHAVRSIVNLVTVLFVVEEDITAGRFSEDRHAGSFYKGLAE